MDIKPIQSIQSPTSQSGARAAGKVSETAVVQNAIRRDKLELSGEAQGIRDAQRAQKLSNVRAQLRSGYYDSPEVIRETAANINRALKAR